MRWEREDYASTRYAPALRLGDPVPVQINFAGNYQLHCRDIRDKFDDLSCISSLSFDKGS